MPQTDKPNLAKLLALTAASLALAACDVRREGGGEEEPEPAATTPGVLETEGQPTPTPTPSDTRTASIIRDDIAPAVEEPDEPAEPFAATIPFPDGPELTPAAERMLVSALSSDAMDEDWPVILGGHTDSTGNDQANLRSSRARAEAVAAWLVEYGVDTDRIEVIAFGEQNPVRPNARPDGTPNEEGRRANRRVELRIAPPAGSRPAPSETPGSGSATATD